MLEGRRRLRTRVIVAPLFIMAAATFFVREATEHDCDEIMRMLKVSLVSVRPIHSCVCVCVCA